jgi:hypothetical protein
MTNKSYTKLLQKCARAYNRYDALYEKARNEYIRRYGESPGEHDNDQWIDSLEGGGGDGNENVTAEIVDEWAVQCDRESYLSNVQDHGPLPAKQKQ